MGKFVAGLGISVRFLGELPPIDRGRFTKSLVASAILEILSRPLCWLQSVRSDTALLPQADTLAK